MNKIFPLLILLTPALLARAQTPTNGSFERMKIQVPFNYNDELRKAINYYLDLDEKDEDY